MYFYKIAVASNKYHGKDLLTYCHDAELPIGSIIIVPLQRAQVHGFVVSITDKPSFKTKSIIEILALPPLPQTSVQLFLWALSYYPSPSGILAQLFLPPSFPKKVKPLEHDTAQKSTVQTYRPPALSSDQQAALNIASTSGSFLLHGETGSGKTRVYVELAKKAIEQNKSAIILTPEISLTSQLTHTFAETFGTEKLIVLHSQLTPATRRDIWIRLLSNNGPYVIIGPRSTLFSPLKDIGLIAVDESHEYAYKQENTPFYHATRIAGKIAQLHDATFVLGSATPSIQDYHLAQSRHKPIIRMSAIDTTTTSPLIYTIDMRKDENHSSSPFLSKRLVQEIKDKLTSGQQVLLFINRRGTARIILCEDCGWQATCPHCDLPLTYHHDEHILRCHTCGITEKARSACDECGGTEIILKSIGTKSVALTVEKLFPSARVQRFDSDNRKGERLNELYDEIRSGKIDILIGTQLLAKGLDLPKLGLVGIINADASLYIPDFTAQEKAYQLIYQLIGRVGRSSQEKSSSVVIQTYTPENPTIQAATGKNWDTFYKAELAERESFMFPPFCHLLKVSCKRARSVSAQAAAEKLAKKLQDHQLAIQIDGPAPAFHEKVQNKYVWQLIIKSKQRSELLRVIELLPADWSYDIDPANLL